MSTFAEYLATFDESQWLAAIDELLPYIHEVDKNAVQIWFRFYPLSLHRYVDHVDAAENRDDVLRGLALKGQFELKGQIDTSHHFLYGHRFWKKTKCVIEKTADEYKGEETSLVETIRSVGMPVAKKFNVDRKLTNAIAAVGLMTLTQVGLEAFKGASGDFAEPTGVMKKSPESIVSERAKDDSQGIFGFLKTIDKKFSVIFSGAVDKGKFPIVMDEEIASASQKDHSQQWQARDERCWDGPVPVECTSASCGTCWVGVIAGAEKLTEVKPRERRA
ncbi:MAG: hypothetical protein JO314_04695, partial [Acidobacteria bacterium]|nr:hypothetical protein [Acidobacteriota bacterium]